MAANITTNRRTSGSGGPARQRGIVLVFAAIALFSLLAMGALALDAGNMILNKGKLQTMVDAAALSAARTLDLGGDHALATTAANEALTNNLAQTGFSHMSLDGATTLVQFSDSLPFVAGGSATAPYVRVAVANVDLPEFFARLFPDLDEMVSASAVAGPSTALTGSCSLVPIMVCGKDGEENFGYPLNKIEALKYSQPDEAVGTGNFHLLRLPDAAGAADVRRELAGSYDSCFFPAVDTGEGPMVATEPGNKSGPTAQGLNTRFGQYSGGGVNEDEYPPDIHPDVYDQVTVDKKTGAVTIPGNVYDVGHYLGPEGYGAGADYSCALGNTCEGGAFRRILLVPVADCSQPVNGQGELPYLGLACFFLIQPVDQSDAYVVGQFIKDCSIAAGLAGNTPSAKGPHKIQLYRDNLSGDS